jgi:hypothetical protein
MNQFYVEDFSASDIYRFNPLASRGKELYEEAGFWNNADTAFDKHVDVGV